MIVLKENTGKSMKNIIQTGRKRGLTVEITFAAAAEGDGIVLDTATDHDISQIGDVFPDAGSALQRMTDVAMLRRGVKAMIVDIPDGLFVSAPH